MNRSSPLPLAMVTSLGLLVLAAIPAPALPETATSPSTVIEWWDTTGPGAAMTVIRLAAMVACGYVAAVAVLYTLADALRLGWLRRLALLAASPALRRQLSAGALTLAVVATTPATAHAQAAHDEPSIVLTDVGAVPAGHQVEAEPSSILIADIGPAIIEPPAEQTVRHVTCITNITKTSTSAGRLASTSIASTSQSKVENQNSTCCFCDGSRG